MPRPMQCRQPSSPGKEPGLLFSHSDAHSLLRMPHSLSGSCRGACRAGALGSHTCPGAEAGAGSCPQLDLLVSRTPSGVPPCLLLHKRLNCTTGRLRLQAVIVACFCYLPAKQSSGMQAQRMQKEDTKGLIRMEVKLLNGADVILQLVRSPAKKQDRHLELPHSPFSIHVDLGPSRCLRMSTAWLLGEVH